MSLYPPEVTDPLTCLDTFENYDLPKYTLGYEALAFAAKYLRHVDGDRAGERWIFTPRQARWILWWYSVDENGDWLYGQGSRRLGKGPIAHTELVPTPQGWKKHGDLELFDEVYAVDGSITHVVDLGQEVNEDCYKLTWEDGSTVKCTGSHRWPLEDGRIMTVEEMNVTTEPLMSRSVPGISESRDLLKIEPIEPEPARCITVAHPEHQYLVGEGRVPTCNSGKSPWAAVMCIIELMAPVRFSHFDPSLPGGVAGKPVAMPLVQLAANSFDQAKNTFSIVRAMLAPANSPKLHEDYSLEVGKEKVFIEPFGIMEIISSSSASAEGARATFIICDESEHWTPESGGVELFNTLKANATKTGSRIVETCNAWRPDRGSVAELNFKAWASQQEGTERELKRRVLYDSVMAPLDTNISDEASLRKGLEHVYQDNPWSLKVLDSIISDIYTSSTPLEASKRKYLNWPTTAESAWIDPVAWGKLANPDRKVERDEEIVMFFDGSLSRDATALIGCCVKDGHIFTIGVWEPNNSHRSKDKIDVNQVNAKVDWAFAYYNVQAFFADVYQWENSVKVTWPEKHGDSLAIWATPRGEIKEPIAWDMRGKLKDFTLAAELVETEINNGDFTHDGNPILARHVGNARRYENRFGISIVKESKDSPNKIDAAVCMIGARHALRVLKENANDPMSYEAFFL